MQCLSVSAASMPKLVQQVHVLGWTLNAANNGQASRAQYQDDTASNAATSSCVRDHECVPGCPLKAFSCGTKMPEMPNEASPVT